MNLRETVEAPPVVLNRLADVEVALALAIRGKPEVIRLSLVCLLARGHLLIEDVPGVGKTTLAHALARSVDCQFLTVAIHQRHASERCPWRHRLQRAFRRFRI